jgi:DNA ligase-1
MEFPTLYATAKTGKVKVWAISVVVSDAPTITVSAGYIDGKKVISKREVTSGKNIGKKNETTPLQQAINEATAKWTDKKGDGFTESAAEAEEAEIIRPMLAHDYHKVGKKMVFPCMVQPKLDGVRAYYDNGVLYSRTGKAFAGLDHIIAELKEHNLRFDGELYSDKYTFQEIVGMVKKKQKGTENIHLVVYDIVDATKTFEERHAIVNGLFKGAKSVETLLTETCPTASKLKEMHDKYVQDGYEGLILRNIKGKYAINARSNDLQKYKEFLDDEFVVSGFTEGEGVEDGLVLWECKTKEGKKFTVRPRGTHTERAKLFKDGKKFIGKFLTVRFQEYTDDGIPRFPVGVGIREDGM